MNVRLAVLLIAVASSFSAVAASESDIQDAKVITVTTDVVSGHLNIANGRNCLSENAQGKPALLACESAEKVSPEKSTVRYIVLKSGQCLSDAGGKTPVMAVCDFQDKKQQWTALQGIGTDVRNMASNKCLTTAGLDKPVTMATCAGLPAQNWTLPQ
ncbi:ricin-type beta-trefoil lectin domain protein [Yersinia sp. 2545 StPb PI]|uniref:ricin-type beta-trefoil lectin domain protein n=1 Tax=unclassified Yersinia (in: enterobacteria) TaxID=2653513 RepID=UPI003FA40ED5